jgi:hypothetical protein
VKGTNSTGCSRRHSPAVEDDPLIAPGIRLDMADPVRCLAWCVVEHLVWMLEDMPIGIDETEGGVAAHRVRSGAWGTPRQNSGS